MKTLLLVIIIFATPLCLRAQDFRALGKSTREVRKLYASGPYITKLESDTCDTFLLSDSVRFRIFYKGGKCVKMENIFEFGYIDGFKAAFNNTEKKIGENTWIAQHGTIKVEMTAIKNRNECILDFSAVGKNGEIDQF